MILADSERYKSTVQKFIDEALAPAVPLVPVDLDAALATMLEQVLHLTPHCSTLPLTAHRFILPLTAPPHRSRVTAKLFTTHCLRRMASTAVTRPRVGCSDTLIAVSLGQPGKCVGG